MVQSFSINELTETKKAIYFRVERGAQPYVILFEFWLHDRLGKDRFPWYSQKFSMLNPKLWT